MKTGLLIIGLLILAATTSAGPKKADWLCWSTAVHNQECGTYGWHPTNKKAAARAAQELCVHTCQAKCVVEYCERAQ